MKLNQSNWIFHAEWFAAMGTMVGCFLFVHHESVRCNERIDNHINSIHQRCDALNQRQDDLHKEFYELLKEMRK